MKTDWVKEYSEVRQQYQSFSKKLEGLIEELLKTNKIDYHLIESRTKEVKSFEEKLKRKQEIYTSLAEITDLSGLRIIVYYPEDIEKIIGFIKDEFEIDDKNSVIKGEEFGSNEFGYKSFHIVFNVAENRKSLSEWRQYKDFKCEIQLRTVLQHAWASISHTLQYKSKHDIPKTLQRKLFRLASLFELADEQFSEIKKDHTILINQIKKENIETSNRDLNLLSIEQFIKKSNTVKDIYKLALKCGFIDQNDDLSLEPPEETETISNLISICDFGGINSIRNLEGTLKAQGIEDLKKYFARQLKEGQSKGRSWYVSPAFIIVMTLIYVHKDKITLNHLIQLGWDQGISERIIENL